jgi:two-component system CheB/CheR fusion protein
LIERRKQNLTLNLPDEPLHVEADPARLQQLQANLLTNASKYTPDGGRIWLKVESGTGEAVISVRDDGAGLPEEMQGSIFDLFVQSDAAIGRSDGGLGVGLTLVKSIVEKHGGRIEVHSGGPGAGSEFIVRLPQTSKRLAPLRPAPRLEKPSHVKVLIVEDNPDARSTLCTLLELEGFTVTDAADGIAALEALDRERPDVALIDVGLPKLDGYEVARRIRDNDAHNGVLLIALTGYGQASDRFAALAAGFDAHLVKPLNTSHLMQLLAEKFAETAK